MPVRRDFLTGLGAAGLVASSDAKAKAVENGAPHRLAGLSGQPGLQHSMLPCRFGAIHYRYMAPVRSNGHLPVICLHASPASSIGLAAFLEAIGTDRLAIGPDNPGFGLSDRPDKPSRIEDFAGAIWDLMDGMGIKRVNLVGSNTGAATGVEMARQRPAAVRRLVLHSAPMLTDQEIAAYQARLAGSHPPDIATAVSGLVEGWTKFKVYSAGLSEDILWQMFWEMQRDPLHRGWGHDAAFAYDFAANLRQLRQPVLILNPNDGLAHVTARARGIAPNIVVKDLPWTEYPFSGRVTETSLLVRQHFDA